MDHPRIPLILYGNYSLDFLEELGYRPFFPPLVEAVSNPTMPQPITLAYEQTDSKENVNEDT